MARWFPKMIECTILQQIEVRINLCEKKTKKQKTFYTLSKWTHFIKIRAIVLCLKKKLKEKSIFVFSEIS